jgi:general stress protein YciG
MAQDHTKPQETVSQDNDTETTSGGRGWHGDSEGHARAGRKGGTAVSRNREHMAQIGSKGGKTVSNDREHMAQIGSRGGKARGQKQASPEQNSSSKKS